MAPTILKRVEGVVGSLEYDPLDYCILAAGTAIAWAYCLELTIIIFYTFRRRTGLYFWSLLVSSWGCTLHALGFVLKFMTHTPSAAFLPFIELGWTCMVTGQSLVLYSRLHLVVRKRLTLRLVLIMIIWNAITLHTPTIVLTIGSNGPNGDHWAPIFNIMERIQLAIFCVQEFIISTVYIYYTVKLLGSIYHNKTRTVMFQLIVINGICLGMDIVLIGLEYSNNYVGETSIKPMLYAIKLKLEFAVLNQLVSLTKAGFTEGQRRATPHSHDHELRRNPSSDNAVPRQTTRIFRGSLSKRPSDPPPPTRTDQILTTQQVDVVSEPKSKFQVRTSIRESPHSISRAQSPYEANTPQARFSRAIIVSTNETEEKSSEEDLRRSNSSPSMKSALIT